MYYSCAPLKWPVSQPRSLLLPSLMAGSVQWRGRRYSTRPPSETLSPWCTHVECMTTLENLLSGYKSLSNASFSKLKLYILYIIYLIMSYKFMHCKFSLIFTYNAFIERKTTLSNSSSVVHYCLKWQGDFSPVRLWFKFKKFQICSFTMYLL